jgi:hypothetical protein
VSLVYDIRVLRTQCHLARAYRLDGVWAAPPSFASVSTLVDSDLKPYSLKDSPTLVHAPFPGKRPLTPTRLIIDSWHNTRSLDLFRLAVEGFLTKPLRDVATCEWREDLQHVSDLHSSASELTLPNSCGASAGSPPSGNNVVINGMPLV